MKPLVLVTWNVHAWVGSDGLRDPARSLELVLGWDADVVALQEVEGAGGRCADAKLLADWARRGGYRLVMGPTLRRGRGQYGNVVLTRLPLRGVRLHALGPGDREARGAIDLDLAWEGGPVRVVATHLGLGRRERRRQAARLARALAEGPGQMLLAGDFNDWTPGGWDLGALRRAVGPFSSLRTFPSRRALMPLDRVALRMPGARLRAATVRDRDTRAASDHLPLRAEVELDRA